MDLYFSPLACSMASRITIYEAEGQATFIQVDSKTKKTLDGADYLAINPLGLVPALRVDGGETLLENAAILQYLAASYPAAGLMPETMFGQAKLRQWLSFIGTELHKALFVPLFDKDLGDTTRAKVIEAGARRLQYLDHYLTGRTYLLDRFGVADAYLTTVLNWHIATPVDVQAWPAIAAYFARMTARPSIARAMKEEFALYAEEQKRQQAA